MTFKPTLLALAAFSCIASTASAAIVVVSGTTVGGPTFNRPVEDLSGLSGIGTAVAYNAYTFTVSVSGAYTFTTTAPAFDSFTFLYSPSFNRASPLTNALTANDDLFGIGQGSGFAYTLTANTNYVYVTTGFANTDFGAFTNVIGGPGNITAVPEPATVLTMVAGLAALGAAAGAGRRGAARGDVRS